ncbi:MAG: glycosyltransferase family 2 protein [Candidatus Omnitrophica bacterium]|nr:glycosyltransferase family 2 protein [Candidatus Omnitrophota bacterium]
MPDISFIIPALNEKETLRYTLANLFKTVTQQSFEVIVVDDGSEEDLSGELIDPGKVIYIKNHQRLGVSKSRNRGARQARGQVLVFLDAHVCFVGDWLSKILKKRKQFKDAVMGIMTYPLTDIQVFWEIALSGVPPKKKIKSQPCYGFTMTSLPMPELHAISSKRFHSPFEVPIVTARAMIVEKNLFFELGGFLNELTGYGALEDTEFCMRAWIFGKKVLAFADTECYHCLYGPRSTKSTRVEYEKIPFYTEKYEGGVENAFRIFYLHSSENQFKQLIDFHKNLSGFSPNLSAILTDELKAQKEWISKKRIHDEDWLFQRMKKVG